MMFPLWGRERRCAGYSQPTAPWSPWSVSSSRDVFLGVAHCSSHVLACLDPVSLLVSSSQTSSSLILLVDLLTLHSLGSCWAVLFKMLNTCCVFSSTFHYFPLASPAPPLSLLPLPISLSCSIYTLSSFYFFPSPSPVSSVHVLWQFPLSYSELNLQRISNIVSEDWQVQ